jgi:hypothetical protein
LKVLDAAGKNNIFNKIKSGADSEEPCSVRYSSYCCNRVKYDTSNLAGHGCLLR